MARLGTIVALLSALAVASSTKRSNTVIHKSGKEDLQTSESGYSYQIRSGGPFTYPGADGSVRLEEIRYPVDEERSMNLRQLPEITMGRYSHNPVPLKYLSLKPKFDYTKPSASSGEQSLYPYAQGFDTFLDTMKGGLNVLGKFVHLIMKEPMSYDKPVPLHLKPIKGIPEVSDELATRKDSNFLESLGSSYESTKNAERGEKGTSGYAKEKEFAKGLKGEYADNKLKGFYGLEGGKKSAEAASSGSYADNHQNRKSHRGGAFSNSKGRDKGSKTTGYHNVFAKDEFKKDHTFYDKSDKRGNFNRFADYDANADSKKGGFRKGGKHNSGFKGVAFGAKGDSDRGKFEDERAGYDDEQGKENYYDRQAEFGNKGGKAFGSVAGYSEGDSFGNK